MLRLLLICALLPFLASAGLSEKQRQMAEYVEKHYAPCILHGTGCVDDQFTYEKIAQQVTVYREYYAKILPKECDCDASSERCNRECYLAFLKKFYVDSAGKRSARELSEKQRQMAEYVEKHYAPCILHGTGCFGDQFTYEKIAQQVAVYREYYAKILPKECDCDASSERCNRECYLAFLKKVYVDSAGN